MPIALWFADELRSFMHRELVEDPEVLIEFFDGAAINRLWTEFLGGRRGHKSILWNLLMFKLWHKRWMQPCSTMFART